MVTTSGAEIKTRVRGGCFPFGNGILRIIRLYTVNFNVINSETVSEWEFGADQGIKEDFLEERMLELFL